SFRGAPVGSSPGKAGRDRSILAADRVSALHLIRVINGKGGCLGAPSLQGGEGDGDGRRESRWRTVLG
ncbi:MAG: hypothetical protein ACRD0L_04185, partial [Acidimicrobiales bacterium]